MNDKDSRRTATYNLRVRLLLALLAVLLVAAAPPVASGPVRLCPGVEPGADCRPVELDRVRLTAPETLLVRTVHVDPRALPLARPSMVWVIALASSEVRWNGALVGRNGVPGPNRAREVPGRFVSTFVVPSRLVRPGENVVSVRLSAHRLWLPVYTPVHVFEVAPYETPALPGLRDYLPALLMLAALVAALLYFGTAWATDRRDRAALLLALIASTASLQLVIEVSRAFIAYTYPWHLARVSAIAVLCAATALLIAAYAVRRFAPGWRWLVPGTALLALAALALPPWFDLKGIAAVLAGAAALAACAARGLRDRRRDAAIALAAALAIPLLVLWQDAGFLDRAYYLWLAAALAVLVAEQVAALRRARAERDAETRRAAALAERLARAERDGEPIVALKDGSRIHRIAEGDILYARAADDYCDVALKDGRTLLVTTSLARLLTTLPARFKRVHKSWAVNRAHIVSISPRPGGGRGLTLSDGIAIPVGRSYAEEVSAWISNPKPAVAKKRSE